MGALGSVGAVVGSMGVLGLMGAVVGSMGALGSMGIVVGLMRELSSSGVVVSLMVVIFGSMVDCWYPSLAHGMWLDVDGSCCQLDGRDWLNGYHWWLKRSHRWLGGSCRLKGTDKHCMGMVGRIPHGIHEDSQGSGRSSSRII
jgi:hypothetical protein